MARGGPGHDGVSALPAASNTAVGLRCVTCGDRHPAELLYACPTCGDILEVEHAKGTTPTPWIDPVVSLGEGRTSLRLARPALLGAGFAGSLLLKDETRNPSGSFKDRLVAAAMSDAVRRGAKRVICASSGNAGASVACYAAHAGISATIVCPETTPGGKLSQILAYGAQLLRVPGDYGQSFDTAVRLASEENYVNLTTTFLNPYGVDALRLVGRELHADLGGRVPDWVFVPTGSGPLVKGVVQGFHDVAGCSPRVAAVQAEGCAPIVSAFQTGRKNVTAWANVRTFASGISDPLRGYEKEGDYTLRLLRETNGCAVAVSDDEIRGAMRDMASREGLFAEPTSASSLAGGRKLLANGLIGAGETIVCMVTGHGFKDSAAWDAACR